ncbi:Alpha/Beta hydrolase protein [Stachybotrys elegans]|uniref:Alpha/Beta hydrolase protein n=1 Tax=Stachybotrys elegans TaxID=80388 RepID=A0A8K0WVB6_9HYPO|nr:Alpha/Beta hydrolase protein [Stachybotrys elegans]
MWRSVLGLIGLLTLALGQPVASSSPRPMQTPAHDTTTTQSISLPLFASLERLARLVDISYCIGSTGVSKPFRCVSWCSEFPTLSLVTTWNTGILLSDSCGYIAVDHGTQDNDMSAGSSPKGSSQGSIIVAFRGTYSLANTVIDLSTIPQTYIPYPSPDHGGKKPGKPEHECTNCTVHMGFLESWNNARKLVLPELETLRAQYPSYPIHLVGHSLGGSVACLAALEMKVSLGWNGIVVTTFGEPRVGNYQLSRFVDEMFDLDGDTGLEERSYRRVTHTSDPVPLLPLDEWGYRPHAGEIFISKKDLSPSETDVYLCVGDDDPSCSAGDDGSTQDKVRRLDYEVESAEIGGAVETSGIPTRFKLWELLFAHRDYFWRLGLCVPGGDPANWPQKGYDEQGSDEL